jgi:hypothetical protein
MKKYKETLGINYAVLLGMSWYKQVISIHELAA